MAFDICTICQHQDDKGKCTKPGYCCDTSEDFVLKPVYVAAPEMYKALKEVYRRSEDMYLMTLIEKILAKAEGRD